MPASPELISQLRGTLGKLELVLGTIAEAIVWTDDHGDIQWCNAAFDRLAGHQHLKLLGMPFLEALPLEISGRGVASTQELLNASTTSGDIVYERRSASGLTLLEISTSTTVLGDTPTLVFALRDVTARKRAEAAVAAKNRELETLLHVMSHDLRGPMRSINGFSALLTTDRPAEEVQDFLKRIVRATVRMSQLLDDIMTLAQARRIETSAEPLDFGEVAAEVLSRLEGEIAKSGGRARVAAPLPRLNADRTWSTQALYNLVLNALKYTRAGQAPDVEIASYSDAGGIVSGISVLDRGPGVRPQDEERIFQLFQRAVGRDVEGTGAGLAIVHAVAERHGGRAWVRPREGGGSEFTITFGPPG